jgi:transposase
MTDRAGRWVCEQVGRLGRSVAEVARELGCDWHAVNDAVIAYGTPLVEDPARIGPVTALGLDETLFARTGRWRSQQWCTSSVNVSPGHTPLLDVVAGRRATGPSRWLERRPEAWTEAIRFGVLDLSGPYRKTFDDTLPDVIQVADPSHLTACRSPRRRIEWI